MHICKNYFLQWITVQWITVQWKTCYILHFSVRLYYSQLQNACQFNQFPQVDKVVKQH